MGTYVNAQIEKTQQKSECRLRGNRHEMISHIISEFSKLEQKNIIRLDTTG